MKTKKNIYLVCALALFSISLSAIYLNRAYAHIYDTIGSAYLRPPLTSDVDQESATSTRHLIYVSLGDSLTAGTGVLQQDETYPYLVSKQLSGRGTDVELKNFSVPGARTHYLHEILIEPAIGQNPDIITVLIGINDMHGNISVDQFGKEYDYLVRELVTRTNAQIYLIAIPFLGTPDLLWPPYNWYFNYRTKIFNRVIKKIADTHQVHYIDLYTPTVKIFSENGPHYSRDVFHPSAQGYAQWADIISHAITY